MEQVLASLPRQFRWKDAVYVGLTRHQVQQALRQGMIERISRGVYRQAVKLGDGEPWELLRADHLRRCAEFLALHPGHAASHQTAAILHGLDLAVHPDMDVHLTAVERVARTQRYPGAHLHHADSLITETDMIDGQRVTTLARTLADVLRTSRPPHSVAALDAALRDGKILATEVKHVLDGQSRWRGRPRALAAYELRDPRRESWLESYSFVQLHEEGLPIPFAQVDVLDAGFHFVGRVDGLVQESGTFLEADGAGKYLIPAQDGRLAEKESIRVSLEAQEERHDALIALGLTGARWTTEEILHSPTSVACRVRNAIDAGDPERFSGWLRHEGRIIALGQPAAA